MKALPAEGRSTLPAVIFQKPTERDMIAMIIPANEAKHTLSGVASVELGAAALLALLMELAIIITHAVADLIRESNISIRALVFAVGVINGALCSFTSPVLLTR